MRGLLEQILDRINAGEPIAVCTLVAARGSTPQKPPAMMVVLQSGQTLGTIGGGCVEAEVRTRALRRLAQPAEPTNVVVLTTFQLNHDFGWDDGLVCGGTMKVALHTVRSKADAAPYQAVRDAIRAGQPAMLRIVATDDNAVAAAFEHRIEPQSTLVIVGAGHVGEALAAVAKQLDFMTFVIDDRPDLAIAARMSQAQCIVGPIDQELTRFPVDANTYVVIVTRGHRHDALALASVVASPARYIGLIGSRRKVLTIFEDLLSRGVPREQLEHVHAPVGLDIGAITPGEIAISIAAELVAVRRQREAGNTSSMRLPAALLPRT